VILYHFTSAYHLSLITAAGHLKVVESNISRTREHAGPDVVWLTSNPEPTAQPWIAGATLDKSEIRITVDVPKREARKWRTWAASRGIDSTWAKALALPGCGSWYVVARPVPSTEWVEIANARTGEPAAKLAEDRTSPAVLSPGP
jgi:hypothetical protein